jgi:hypothetical protein
VLTFSSSDGFHLEALQAYIESFDFDQQPIDIALRHLLMELNLPRETQQIDRVMETFAKRWHAQNAIFSNSDVAYVLSFSLIMLHTDAFNKHNKSKMTKADYVKNTRIDGVSAELLEYLYDNITHQPFVFVEGNDIHGGKGFDGNSSQSTFSLGLSKADVYALMADVSGSSLLATCPDLFQGQLRRLKPGVEQLIPFKSEYFDLLHLEVDTSTRPLLFLGHRSFPRFERFAGRFR